MDLDELEKSVLKTIGEHFADIYSTTESVYKRCRSFDRTIEILKLSAIYAIPAEKILHLSKNELTKAPRIAVISGMHCGATIINDLQDIPNIAIVSEPLGLERHREVETFIYTKLPEIEQPRIVSIKEAEEPFYKRFDKRRGKRKNRR